MRNANLMMVLDTIGEAPALLHGDLEGVVARLSSENNAYANEFRSFRKVLKNEV